MRGYVNMRRLSKVVVHLVIIGLFVSSLPSVIIAHSGHSSEMDTILSGVGTRSQALIDRHFNDPFPSLSPATPVGNAAYALAALWKNQDTVNANQLIEDINST